MHVHLESLFDLTSDFGSTLHACGDDLSRGTRFTLQLQSIPRRYLRIWAILLARINRNGPAAVESAIRPHMLSSCQ
jgi:hypothetical protein